MASVAIHPNQISSSWINITEKCQNHCLWCYAKNSLHARSRNMPLSKVKTLLGYIHASGAKKCCLLGGEPTLHPHLQEIILYGQKIGVEITFVSNGRKFADLSYCQALKDSGLRTGLICLSLHASSPEDSALFTGSVDYYTDFVQGLKNLLSLGIIPGINITITRHTRGKFEVMLPMLKNLGIKRVDFNFGSPSVSQYGVDKSFCLNPAELGLEVIAITQLCQKLELNPMFIFNIPFCLVPQKIFEKLYNQKSVLFGCEVKNGSSVLFNIDGDLITCNHLLDAPVIKFSQVKALFRKNQFADFWTSPKALSIRKAACVYRVEACKTCDYLGECGGGGCPLLWHGFKPENYIFGWKGGELTGDQ